MKLIHGLYNLPAHWDCSVVTIGNFDGLHKGHQALIERCVSLAKKHKAPSVLMTFEPYPQAYFSNDERIPRLMSLRDKYLSLQAFGIDYLLVLPFNAALAQVSADAFVRDILVERLKIKGLVVGDDFRFGAKRVGDFSLLASYAERCAYDAQQVPTRVHGEERISSSRLRAALADGNIALAEALLGRPYCLSGRIVKGDQRGREFGFPTANVYVGQKKLPLSGIFVVTVDGLEKAALPGVASMGYRPMYPTEKDVLEVYLLDFNKDVYQKQCTVTFLKRLRGEEDFSSEAALVAQIEKDVAETKDFFAP